MKSIYFKVLSMMVFRRWSLAAVEWLHTYLIKVLSRTDREILFVLYVFFKACAAVSKSKCIFGQWAVTIICSFQQKAHIDSVSASWCIIVILMSALTFRPFYQMLVDVSAALLITVITFRHTISKQSGRSSLILLYLRTRSPWSELIVAVSFLDPIRSDWSD